MDKGKKKKAAKRSEEETRDAMLKSLPITFDQMTELFDYLDLEIIRQGCEHRMTFTKRFLAEKKLPEKETIVWLNDQGADCDCEVLAKIEQKL